MGESSALLCSGAGAEASKPSLVPCYTLVILLAGTSGVTICFPCAFLDAYVSHHVAGPAGVSLSTSTVVQVIRLCGRAV